MKQIFNTIILFFVFNICYSQKTTLKSIAKALIKAIEKSDTTELKKVTITYSDYLFLSSVYNEKYNIHYPLVKEIARPNHEFYTSQMQKLNREVYLVRQYWWVKDKNIHLKYLTYSFEITSDSKSFTQKARVNIYIKKDEKLIILGYLFCYKVKGEWKLAGLEDRFVGSPPEDKIKKWINNFGSYHDERVPDWAHSEIWKLLWKGGKIDSTNDLILTRKEFNYYFRLYAEDWWGLPDTITEEIYLPYLERIFKSISRINDSLIKSNIPKNYKQEFISSSMLLNSPTSNLVRKLGYYFSYQVDLPDETIRWPAFIQMIPTGKNSKKPWKIFDINEFRNFLFFSESSPLGEFQYP